MIKRLIRKKINYHIIKIQRQTCFHFSFYRSTSINFKSNWSMLTVTNCCWCRTCIFTFISLVLLCLTSQSTIFFYPWTLFWKRIIIEIINWKFPDIVKYLLTFCFACIVNDFILWHFWYFVLWTFSWYNKTYLRYINIAAMITTTTINTEILPPTMGIVGISDV